ncbi:beta-galactosidase [Candidatus Falkowbacteria bacterium]|nr:beta-galactosidase [Candidatus Falkowbacteria bacterium]
MLKNLYWLKIFFIVLVLILFFIFLLSRGRVYGQAELEYGVTFSKKQAEDLGLDWRKIYLSIFDDLGVKKIRLPAYWNEIEKEEGNYSWEGLDWQINQAGERQAEIILAVGARLPRWPECHFPDWTSGRLKAQIENKILDYINKTIERYKGNKNIVAWQIENEPFLSHFGDCPKFDKKFLDQEIMLTRSLDNRPIVITDSGELSLWVGAAKRADIFGTTMYRDTYSSFFKTYIHYPILPGFFRLKKNLAGLFAKPKDWLVIEMQAEPWGPKPYQNLSQIDRDKTMEVGKFKEMIEFGRQAGFREFYLWGVEFWYWEFKEGRPEMWQYARTLFNR